MTDGVDALVPSRLSTPGLMTSTMLDRRMLRPAVAIVVAAIVAVVVVVAVTSTRHHRVTRSCTATVPTRSYKLTMSQAANATTIAAIGKRMGLPDHAVTIALAAALQESGLQNLPGGDRDSVGLFQQRPSQGWGSATQLVDPRYATSAFYRALINVPSWADRAVNDAAQRVQRSGTPSAYARWETEARTLARVLTGQVAAGFACRFDTPTNVTTARAVDDAMASELGSPGVGTTVSPARGWTIASWLIGHADDYGIERVTFADRAWSPSTGTLGCRVRRPPAGRIRGPSRVSRALRSPAHGLIRSSGTSHVRVIGDVRRAMCSPRRRASGHRRVPASAHGIGISWSLAPMPPARRWRPSPNRTSIRCSSSGGTATCFAPNESAWVPLGAPPDASAAYVRAPVVAMTPPHFRAMES